MKPIDLLRVLLDSTGTDDQVIGHAINRLTEDTKALAQISEEAALSSSYAVARLDLLRRLYADYLEVEAASGFGIAPLLKREVEAALAKNPNPAGHPAAEPSAHESGALAGEGSGPVGLGPTEARHEIGTCNDDAEQFPVMEAVDQFGWCAWVRPLPGYRMQCCGCGLVHELDLAIIEDVNLKADGSWDARNVVPEGLSPVFRMRRSACPDPSMGKFACTNRAQCWEPCGDLGNDDRYVGKADSEVSAAVDRAMGIDREKPVLAVGNLLADAAREALWVMEHGNTDEPGEPGRLAAVRWTAAKKGLRDALAQPVLSQDSTNLNPASHVRCTEGSGATPAPIRSEPSGLAGLGPDSPISGNLAAGPGAITFAALTPPKCIYCGEPCTGNYYGVSDAQGTRCWHNPTCPATGLDAFTDAEVNAEFKRRNQPPPNPQAPTMKEPR